MSEFCSSSSSSSLLSPLPPLPLFLFRCYTAIHVFTSLPALVPVYKPAWQGSGPPAHSSLLKVVERKKKKRKRKKKEKKKREAHPLSSFFLVSFSFVAFALRPSASSSHTSPLSLLSLSLSLNNHIFAILFFCASSILCAVFPFLACACPIISSRSSFSPFLSHRKFFFRSLRLACHFRSLLRLGSLTSHPSFCRIVLHCPHPILRTCQLTSSAPQKRELFFFVQS